MSGDIHWDKVKLYLQYGGADGSTTFTDSSPAGTTVTAHGNAQIDTAQSVAGGSSGLFDGDGDALTFPGLGNTSESFSFRTHFRPAGSHQASARIFQTANGDVLTAISLVASSSTQIQLYAHDGVSAGWTVGPITANLSLNTQHQIQVDYDVPESGNPILYFFVDGTLISSHIIGLRNDQSNTWGLGGQSTGASRSINGHLDLSQFTAGVARNTSSFTPPATPYPTNLLFQSSSQIAGLLGAPSVLSTVTPNFAARSAIPSLLGSPQARLKMLNGIYASLPSLLGAPKTSLLTDVSSLLTDRTERYVMVVSGSPPVEIPVSSWSGTRQVDRRNFLQCSVPNSSEYVQEITARLGSEKFTVYRVGFIEDRRFDFPVASAALETSVNSRGGLNETLTIQGYEDASTGEVSPTTRNLSNLRQTSHTLGGNFRARCDIDWIVQPGQTVDADGFTFTADYINYFVPRSGDVYMDVGSRG